MLCLLIESAKCTVSALQYTTEYCKQQSYFIPKKYKCTIRKVVIANQNCEILSYKLNNLSLAFFAKILRHQRYVQNLICTILRRTLCVCLHLQSRHYPWAPKAVLSGLCLVVPLLIQLMPETSGRDLPQTIADMETWLGEKPRKCKEKSADKEGILNQTFEGI